MENIILYNTEDGKVSLKLYAENNTVWLTQAQMAELFDKNISTISRHVTNIFDENEVDKKSNLRFMQIANKEEIDDLIDVKLAKLQRKAKADKASCG